MSIRIKTDWWDGVDGWTLRRRITCSALYKTSALRASTVTCSTILIPKRWPCPCLSWSKSVTLSTGKRRPPAVRQVPAGSSASLSARQRVVPPIRSRQTGVVHFCGQDCSDNFDILSVFSRLNFTVCDWIDWDWNLIGRNRVMCFKDSAAGGIAFL